MSAFPTPSAATASAACTLRPIRAEDNPHIRDVIRAVLTEIGCVGEGFAHADPELDRMFETYSQPRAAYFVLESEGKILGGAGFSPLKGAEATVCEFQKMYFLPETRGRGLGRKLLALCLEEAKKHGFTTCYIETVQWLEAALALYASCGFEKLEGPMGATGHFNCNAWLARAL